MQVLLLAHCLSSAPVLHMHLIGMLSLSPESSQILHNDSCQVTLHMYLMQSCRSRGTLATSAYELHPARLGVNLVGVPPSRPA